MRDVVHFRGNGMTHALLGTYAFLGTAGADRGASTFRAAANRRQLPPRTRTGCVTNWADVESPAPRNFASAPERT
jgi:hypothetical protein